MKGLTNPRGMQNLKLLASAVAKIFKGTAQFWGAPLGHFHAHFSSGREFIMNPNKPQAVYRI